MIEQEEPYESRGSRTVLWERRGETPLRDPTREEERRVIARTIHDDLAQLLSSLKIELSSFKGNTDKLDFMVQDTIDTLLLLVEQCMNAVTSIITELRPIILDHLGLIPALKRLFSDFQKHTGISCDLLIREDARNKRKDFFQRDSL